MAFENVFRGIDFQAPVRADAARQEQFLNILGNAISQSQQQAQFDERISQQEADRELQKQKLAQPKPFDLKNAAELAAYQKLVTAGMSPQDASIGAKQAFQRPMLDPLGRVVPPANISQNLERQIAAGTGQPLVAPSSPTQPAMQGPQLPVDSGMGDIMRSPAIQKERALSGIESLGKAQTKVDQKFVDDVYVPYKTGKFSDINKQLGDLDFAINALETSDVTGGLKGYIPASIRAIGAPQSVDVQEAVENVVQRDLRETLGPQFTEKEGERLISRAYNPKLDESINKRRILALRGAMVDAATAKQDAINYFDEVGTLKGYKGDTSVLDPRGMYKFINKSFNDKRAQADFDAAKGRSASAPVAGPSQTILKQKGYTQDQINEYMKIRGLQ